MNTSSKPWLDKWIELEEIGIGGQGVVYKLQSKNDPHVFGVLKLIVTRWRENIEAKGRLIQEAQTLQKLNNKNASVPKLYDYSGNHKDSEPFIVMEFINGLTFSGRTIFNSNPSKESCS